MLRPRRSGGETSARPASTSGVRKAFAAPAAARAAMKSSIEGATAAAADATA